MFSEKNDEVWKHHTNVPHVIAYSSKWFLMLHRVSGKLYIDSRPYKVKVRECTVRCGGERVERVRKQWGRLRRSAYRTLDSVLIRWRKACERHLVSCLMSFNITKGCSGHIGLEAGVCGEVDKVHKHLFPPRLFYPFAYFTTILFFFSFFFF